MKKAALLLFLASAAGTMISILTNLEWMHLTCKPLLMISLAAYYWTSVYSKERSNVVMLSICFSFLGDTLLMFGELNEGYFMAGLVSFLLAHTFYVFAYRQHRFDDAKDALQGVQRVRLAFPIVLAATGLLVVLYPSLGALRFPVIIYTIVILLMVLNALYRYGRTSSESFWLVFAGALLFMLSDSVLALNKFYTSINHADVYIMIPYIAGQFMIVQGLIKHTK
jgi:uncharacterized membrane protein YhhN